MKSLILLLLLSVGILNIKAQCPNAITFTYNTVAATCSTCCDGSLTVANIQNGCPAYNIQLSPSATLNGFGSYINLCSGTTYTVKVMDSGCCGYSMLICSMSYSGTTTGINENDLLNALSIYPNPSNGIFFVNSNLKKKEIKIYNYLGQETNFNFTEANQISQVNIPNYIKGIYFIEISTASKLIRKKIVIE